MELFLHCVLHNTYRGASTYEFENQQDLTTTAISSVSVNLVRFVFRWPDEFFSDSPLPIFPLMPDVINNQQATPSIRLPLQFWQSGYA